jgi:hypothetical protein
MIRTARLASPLALLAVLAFPVPAPAQSGDAAAPAVPAAPTAPAALALGATLPMGDVAMKNVDGRTITLAKSAGGKGTLVLFICNHCPWVKLWQPRIAEVGNAALKQGVGVVAVNGNDPAPYPEDEFDVMVTRAKEVGYSSPRRRHPTWRGRSARRRPPRRFSSTPRACSSTTARSTTTPRTRRP